MGWAEEGRIVYTAEMPYRNEADGLRVRVQELEGELAEAKEKIARLEGKGVSTETASDQASWFTGVSPTMRLERELDLEITEEGYEAVAELLRQRLGEQGTISQVGRTLTYKYPGVEIRVQRTGQGKTRVHLNDSRGGLAVGMGVLAVAGAITSSLPIAAILQGTGQSPGWFVASLPFLLLASYGVTRKLMSGGARTHRAKLAGAFEGIVEVAKKHARPLERVRVAVESEEAVEEHVDPSHGSSAEYEAAVEGSNE